MEALIKRRSVIKGQITKLHNFARSCKDTTSYDDMHSRLEKLKEHYTSFVNIEDQMFSLDPEVASDIDTVDDNYYFCVSTLQKLMRAKIQTPPCNLNETTLNSSSSGLPGDFKLPRLKLPIFTGKPRDWQSFYDLFKSTVHENTSLSPAQKFQYLMGQLRGPPEVLVRHFRVDDSSYIEAFQKLVKRYDRKRSIVNDFIETYISQPRIVKPSADTIGKLFDTCDETIRGLKALGQSAELRDCWLVYLAERKLDDTTLQMWKHESSDLDFPTIDELLEFLSKRMNSLEGLKQPTTKVQGKQETPTKIFHTNNETRPPPNCTLCNNQQHRLCDCPTFIEMALEKRRQYINSSSRCFNCLAEGHVVFKCRSRGRCHQCQRKHHTLVHTEPSNPQPSFATESNPKSPATTIFITSKEMEVNEVNVLHSSHQPISYDALLPTAIVEVRDRFGEWRLCRALLDSASTRSYVTENCARRLNVVRSNARFNINTINGGRASCSRGVSSLLVRSRTNKGVTFDITAYILPKITSNLPPKSINRDRFEHLNHLTLADPDFHIPGNIDLLIGCDKFLLLLSEGQIKKDEDHPVAQKTILGWIVGGNYESNGLSQQTTTCLSAQEEMNIDQTLRKFWETEDLPAVTQHTEEERCFIEHFNKHLTIEGSGKFTVRLPFKPNKPALGESFNQAIRRFKSLEQRLMRDPELHRNYTKFLEEYESLGHMEAIPESEVDLPNDKKYYLPHHPVRKETSSTTKLRVVFDASAKSTSGVSLNDTLMVGPTIQQTLLEILIRFRKHRYIYTADIEKMFRQLWIDKADTDYQRIIWRDSSAAPIKHYRLLTNTYGTASASFLATQALSKLAELHRDTHPNAADTLTKDFYMDDLMSGASEINDAIAAQTELISLMRLGGYHLRKWASNDVRLLQTIPAEDREISIREITEGTKLISVLGIRFDPQGDCFSFKVVLPMSIKSTKRNMLSEASRVFDPMGWLSPVTVAIKILFQGLWLLKIDWDDELPTDVQIHWLKIRTNLQLLEDIRIPRWLNSNDQVHLCGFADASNAAYAAVIYARSVNSQGKVQTNIIAAKTKVAPIKYLSTARLELCAALLLVRLLASIIKSLELPVPPQVSLCSDSTTVLAWLANPPKKGNIFVLNRVTEILNLTNVHQWSYVKSKQNPADIASRGILPGELIGNRLWWQGPHWLRHEPFKLPETPPERCSTTTLTSSDVVRENPVREDVDKIAIVNQIIERFSRATKAIQVLAWVKRANHNFRNVKFRIQGPLTVAELYESYKIILKEAQLSSFPNEIINLRNNLPLNKSNYISSLSPYLDKAGIMRVGGRLTYAKEQHDLKHPIILAGNHPITRKIIYETHERHLHAGPNLLMSILKEQYAILRCKDLIRSVIYNCVKCFRQRKITQEQLMGQLPPPRVNLIRPFLQTSVDCAGPYTIKASQARKFTTYKGYLVIFTCMATKAMHLELASDMTTDTFLAAFKRFQSRRGICTDVYSDNGTNFVGAANELKHFQQLISKEEKHIAEWAATNNTKWHFIPPASPHFNGLCEAAVKSVKFHLRRVIGPTILRYEELNTLLTEIEGLLNSRPLCESLEEHIDALTPAHFIIGQPITTVPEPDIMHLKVNRLSRWQMTQQMFQHFAKRWQSEYLTTLNRLSKWRLKHDNIKIGDLVILKDENLPPGQWTLGRVAETHPGKDEFVRVVTVKTSKGLFKRPITKLSLLPLIDSCNSSTGPICRESSSRGSD